jgi:hypothetical protein
LLDPGFLIHSICQLRTTLYEVVPLFLVDYWVQFWCKYLGTNGINGQKSRLSLEYMDEMDILASMDTMETLRPDSMSDVFSIPLSKYQAVQSRCNKYENPLILMLKQGSVAWICPLNKEKTGLKTLSSD